MSNRYVLIGAHLREEDARAEGVALLPAGELTLSAIEAPVTQDLAARDLVSRTATIRQALAARELFVAIRYGATARTPGEAAGKCASHLDRWRTLLTEWRGHAELTLRAGGASLGARPQRTDFSSGADYLRALHAARHGAGVDAGFLEDAEATLRPHAARLLQRDREDGSTEIAILIRREAIPEAVGAATGLRERWPAVPFLLSGPWPLEVFADG